MKSFFRYLVTLLLCCLCQSAWADVTLMGNMIIGDDSTAALAPTVLFTSSNSVYTPVHPIHFSLSQSGTVTGITLNQASSFSFGATFIVWDSSNNILINSTATDALPATITGSWNLPAGDYQMAVFGACIQKGKNVKSQIASCINSNGQQEWQDIAFTNITLSDVQSTALNFIKRQHIGDTSPLPRVYPPIPTGSSATYNFTLTATTSFTGIHLYQLTDLYNRDDLVDLFSDDYRLRIKNTSSTSYIVDKSISANGDQNWNDAFTLPAGEYQLTVAKTNWLSFIMDDIAWDDIVINAQNSTVSYECSKIFPAPAQGRSSTDYINLKSGNNYVGSRITGTSGGVLGYSLSSQLLNLGYVQQNSTIADGNCDHQLCKASSNASAISLPTSPFPLASSGTSLNVGYNQTQILTNSDGYFFNSITTNYQSSLIFSVPGLKIKTLTVGSDSASKSFTVKFAAGEYWIENLTMGDSASLVFDGNVILHVKNMSLSSANRVNSAGINQSGDPSKLLVIVYNSLYFGNASTLSGYVYQTDDATGQVYLTSASYLFGRVNARSVQLENNSTIDASGATCGVVSSVNHYQLEYVSNNLTCEPASITVKACSDSATPCTVNSEATNSVTLTAANSFWSANPVTLSAGIAKPTLSHYAAESVKLGLGSGTLVCLIDGNVDSSCSIPFVTSAFKFDIQTFYAGTASDNVSISAIKSDSTSNIPKCTALLTGTQNVNFSYQYVQPTTGSLSPSINGTQLSGTTAVPVTFDSFGVGTIKLAYNDAGVLGITAQYKKSDTTLGDLSFSGSDNVAVLPSQIQLTAAGLTACSGTYADCTVYKTVGSPFTLSAQAGYLNGTSFVPTNNFTLESSVKPFLQHQLVAPAPPSGTLPALAQSTLTFAGGAATASISESDVGVYQYRIMASDGITGFVPYPTYQDETTKLTVPKSIDNWSAPVGRFVPAQLKATLVANGSLTTDTCVAANQVSATLGYTGQALRFATGPMLSVTALGSDGATEMKNYQGDFAKIIKITMPGSAKFVAAMTPRSSANTLNSTASWSDGTWTTPGNAYTQVYTFSANNQFTFGKTNTPVTPFETSLVVSTLADSDDVKATSSLPLTFNPMAPDASAFKVYSGRLTLESVNGAENNGLALPFYMQYWNGSAYAINSTDNCTSLTSNALQMNNLTSWTGIPLRVASATNGVATTTASLSPAKVSSGAGAISFTAPNASGWVDIAASSSLPDWMKDFTLPSGLSPARASFGYYRGNDRLIYRREVFGGQ